MKVAGPFSSLSLLFLAGVTFQPLLLAQSSRGSLVLSSSQNPSVFGNAVTLAATVQGSTAPTDTVAFYNGVTLLGKATVTNGQAAIKTALPSGQWPLKAVYSGGSSSSLAHIVNSTAAGSFSAPVPFKAGNGPYSVAAGDFNGDGAADLAVANQIDGTVSVLLGNGRGSFQKAVTYPTGAAPQSVIVADFNGDGNLDLATANYYSSGVSVLLGKGDGTFEPALNYATAMNPRTVASGDFNGDGNFDLAVAGSSGNVSVLLGNGDGTFRAHVDYSVGTGPISVAVGDFNSDGVSDLAVTNNGSGSLSVLLGNGDGSFRAAMHYAVGQNPYSVVVSDFNGDGKADLAVALGSSSVAVLLGNGDGTFQPDRGYGKFIGPIGLAVEDFNGDGIPDIVSANAGAGAVSVLLGNGDGTFQAPVDYAAGTGALSVAIADFNGDGIPDLVTANNGGANISILLGVASSQAQSIAFGPLSNLTLGASPIALAATASSGLRVNFISTTPAACTVQGATVAILTAGTCSITALQPGNADFQAAPRVTQNFAVSFESSAAAPVDRTSASPGSTSQTIAFDKIPNQIFGISPFEIAVQSTSGLPLNIASTTTTVCETSSGLVTLLSTGTCSITASQGGNGTYSAATPVTRSFTVNQAKPSSTLTQAAGGPFSVTGSASSTIVGDFNGDGVQDLAVASSFEDGYANYVTVLLGDGKGGFTATADSPYSVESSPVSIVVGDFNGDGFQDLATANEGYVPLNLDCCDMPTVPNSVTVLLGDGKGGFTEASGSPFSVGYNPGPISIVVGDFNGDGIEDFATANSADWTVSVLLGNGSGGFTPAPDIGVGNSPASVAVGDFNRDGIQDLAIANSGDNTVTVLLGNGSGGFTPLAGSPFPVGPDPVSVVVGDLNRDGFQDLAAADSHGNGVTLLLGNGSGGFTAAAQPFVAGNAPGSLVVADLNGDGIPDLAAANSSDGTVTVLLGNSSDAFTAAAHPFAVGTGPVSVVTGDFNGDGIQDLAAANSDGTVTVLLGGPASSNSVLSTTAPPTIAPGQTVPLTLTVSSSAFNPPTGTATFLDGSTVLGTATQNGSPYSFSTSSLSVGTHKLSANYGGGSGNAASSSNTVTIQVNGALTLQTISFGPLGTQTQGSSIPPLGATASSGLAVMYTSNTTAVCMVSGVEITLLGPGTCSITASQAGNSTYAAATPVTQTFTSIGLQTIKFDAIPNQIFGVSPFPIAAQSNALLPVGFKSTTPAVCRISDNLVMLLSAGTCSITASQPGNASYTSASATTSFTVTVAKPSNSFFAAAGSPIAVPNGVSYATGGDIIGTGVPDLLVLNTTVNPCIDFIPTTLTVMRGNGLGGFMATANSPLEPGSNPVSIVVGDFNGDGFPDIAVANTAVLSEGPGTCPLGPFPGYVAVLLGDGSGGFTSPASGVSIPGTGSYPVSMAVGDFNGDGIQDLAVVDAGGAVSVALGDGAGNFAVNNTVSVPYAAAWVVAGDFNGDGLEDLAVASGSGGGSITVLLGDGAGGFTPAKNSPFAVGTNPASLIVGDFNGDGHQDLAAASGSYIIVLLGDGMGGFTAAAGSPLAAVTTPASLVTGDFNGDGHQDLAAASGNNVTVLLGDGSGKFAAAARSPFAVGTGPASLVVGDFNGDGIEDIAAANVGSNNVTVLLGYVEGTTPQTITFGALSVQSLGSTPPALSAVASSGLAVMFSSNTPAICTVSGVNVTLMAVGTCSITAYQPGNPTYAAAAPVTRSFTVTPKPPAIVSLSPNTGAGASVTFKAVYADPNGASDLGELLLQINSSQSSANACYVYYQPQGNHLYLANNAGAWITPALTPGVAGTASNSQCTLNAGSSSVTTAGNDLALSVELNFIGTFVGAKNVYLYAAGLAGQNTGWVKEGTWVPTSAGPPAIVSLSPNLAGGASVTFKAIYSDPNGAEDLNELLLQINSTQSSANACYVYYQPQGNHLYLANNAGAWITPALTPGVAGTDSNSQCTLNAALSSVADAGNNLTLSVALTFSGTVVGPKNVYLYAAGISGQNSGWVREGTYTPLKPQTIAFDAIPNQILGVSPFPVAAQSSALLPVGFKSPTPAVCKISGDLVMLLTAGTCAIMASQPGNASYAAAASVTQSFTVTIAKTSGSFMPAAGSPVPAGTGSTFVTVGKFNADGVQDLAIANFESNNITVLLGNGSGGFTPAAGSPVTVGMQPHGVTVGDFNGDGKQDLAVVNAGSNNVTVLLGNGSGGFAPAAGSPVTVGTFPLSVAVGDFNGDGIQDLAIANSTSANVVVLLGNGSGGFAPASGSPFPAGKGAGSVAVGDFNGDGIEDLATANQIDGTVTVLIGNGSGGFTPAGSGPFSAGGSPSSVMVGDFNRDGFQDLAIANFNSSNVTVLLGNGSAGFKAAPGSPFNAGTNPYSVAVGDYNGDGIQDLATANYGSNDVTVLLGNGLGGFTVARGSPFAAGAGPPSVVSGDFNGDGIEDLATANKGGNNVTVLLGFVTGHTAQTITFGALINRTLGTGSFALSATASSGLAVTFASKSTSVCTVTGLDVTLVSVGTCSITASQMGDSTWAPATSVTRAFTVFSSGPPAIVSLSPNAGAGESVTFKAVYSDPNGVGDLSELLLQVNASQSSANACYVYYQPQGNHFYLANNAGNAWMMAAPMVSNGQCTLNAASSSVTMAGNDLTLNVALTFSDTFAGAKNVYLYAAGLSGKNSGWVESGTWVP
jgi:Bacterial Ig-like domain (group 3)/FG-GAP-like repeat/FG-GAP repeat